MKIVIYKAMMYKAIAFLHQRKDDQLKLF